MDRAQGFVVRYCLKQAARCHASLFSHPSNFRLESVTARSPRCVGAGKEALDSSLRPPTFVASIFLGANLRRASCSL